MKKIFVVLSLLIFIFSNLDAASAPVNTESKIGLTINPVDKVEFEVLGSTSSGEAGSAIDKIMLTKDTSGNYSASFYFRVKVTSSHQIQITLKSSGALTFDPTSGNEREYIDYTMYHGVTQWDGTSDSIDSDYEDLEASSIVFGKNYYYATVSYEDKNYYHIGKNGYLNLNKATLGSFNISVSADDIVGKTYTTYTSQVSIVACTMD